MFSPISTSHSPSRSSNRCKRPHDVYLFHSPAQRRSKYLAMLETMLRWKPVISYPVESTLYAGRTVPMSVVQFAPSTSDGRGSLAVGNEEGVISIMHTAECARNCSNGEHQCRTNWTAHNNTVFDLSWSKDAERIITASGDETCRLWDVETQKATHAFVGHTGSVKSVCFNPADPDVFASAARDGKVMVWDCRCSGRRTDNISVLKPSSIIQVSSSTGTASRHGGGGSTGTVSGKKKTTKKVGRKRVNSAQSHSVTAIVYLDATTLITGGTIDGSIKVWDARNMRTPVFERRAASGGRRRGITSLSLSSNGGRILVSCTDSRIYMYDMIRLDADPIRIFSGHRCGSFYVKSCFSPSNDYVLSGSSDHNVFVWSSSTGELVQAIPSHTAEVTGVAWSPSIPYRFASCADDATVNVYDCGNHTTALTPFEYPDATTDILTASTALLDMSSGSSSSASSSDLSRPSSRVNGTIESYLCQQ